MSKETNEYINKRMNKRADTERVARDLGVRGDLLRIRNAASPLAEPNPSNLFYGFAEPVFEPVSGTFLLTLPASGLRPLRAGVVWSGSQVKTPREVMVRGSGFPR
eukprot:6848328-Pyramimonas_sp.AAC.1